MRGTGSSTRTSVKPAPLNRGDRVGRGGSAAHPVRRIDLDDCLKISRARASGAGFWPRAPPRLRRKHCYKQRVVCLLHWMISAVIGQYMYRFSEMRGMIQRRLRGSTVMTQLACSHYLLPCSRVHRNVVKCKRPQTKKPVSVAQSREMGGAKSVMTFFVTSRGPGQGRRSGRSCWSGRTLPGAGAGGRCG